MPGSFDCASYLALMGRAQAGSLASSDLSKTGNETLERDCFPKVYVLDVFFAEYAVHVRKVYLLRLYLRLLQ